MPEETTEEDLQEIRGLALILVRFMPDAVSPAELIVLCTSIIDAYGFEEEAGRRIFKTLSQTYTPSPRTGVVDCPCDACVAERKKGMH